MCCAASRTCSEASGVDAEQPLDALLSALGAGEREALRHLYGREAPRLFGIANAILRDRDSAADALQSAFLKIAARAGQFDPVRGEAAAWLGAIVRHSALDLARARGREMPTDDPALGDRPVEPEALTQITAGEEGERLRACLAALEPKNRDGIILAFVHGL